MSVKWHGRAYCANPWRAEDISCMKPEWTMKKGEEWLSGHEDKIQDRLTELGHEVIDSFLQMEGDDDE